MTFGKVHLGLIAAACCALVSACAPHLAGTPGLDLPPPDVTQPVYEYRISPNDRLSITVFPAKDLSLPAARVDATGDLLFPPTGVIKAQGKTVRELTDELEKKLAACCLRDPQVILQVEETTSQQISITGAVVDSGVFNLRGPTTLMQALTFAKGPDRSTANTKQVAVYRISGGKRMGGIFNLDEIRAGKAEDPIIYGGDMIIVAESQTKSAWRNAITAIPFIGVMGAF